MNAPFTSVPGWEDRDYWEHPFSSIAFQDEKCFLRWRHCLPTLPQPHRLQSKITSWKILLHQAHPPLSVSQDLSEFPGLLKGPYFKSSSWVVKMRGESIYSPVCSDNSTSIPNLTTFFSISIKEQLQFWQFHLHSKSYHSSAFLFNLESPIWVSIHFLAHYC